MRKISNVQLEKENMRKKKYIVAAFVLGICVAGCSGTIVQASQEQTIKEDGKDDFYANIGDSEEEQAYRKFLENGNNFSDIKKLSNVMYAVYDINKDKKKELILKGKMPEGEKDEYFFYRYEDKEVKTIGSMENWQNGGEGEMYYVEKGNGIVVYTRLADRKSYSLYQVNNRIEYNFMINKRSLDVKGKDGQYHRKYAYNLRDKNGNIIDKKITQKDWDEFENALVEIPFYNVQMMSGSNFTEDQIDTLKKELGVPDEIEIAKFVNGDPWYWEGTGRWIVSIEMYDADGTFLAGAAIDPDTLELQREIAPYDADRVAQDKAEKSEENSTQNQTNQNQDYLLPDVADRYINEDEIAGFSPENIQLAINEIFARHGRVFSTSEIAAYFEAKSWYQPDQTNTDDQINAEFNEYEKANEKLLERMRIRTTPFYGIWCYGSKDSTEAYNYADTMAGSGFMTQVYITTDWSNLNSETYYVVTAGTYDTEEDANAALDSVRSYCADAYVKYSGDYLR